MVGLQLENYTGLKSTGTFPMWMFEIQERNTGGIRHAFLINLISLKNKQWQQRWVAVLQRSQVTRQH